MQAEVSEAINIINVGTSTVTFTAGTILPSTYSNDFSTTARRRLIRIVRATRQERGALDKIDGR